MSEFPQRSEQHVSEDASIRVFQESLPAKWIFRDQGTRNDYGIDAEVELVTAAGELRGHIAKVQLKGRESLEPNQDGSFSVGGIKPATLRYWLALSRYCNVIVAVTDNAKRETYFTPVFWQATTLLDGTDATTTVRFRSEWSLKADVGPGLFALATIERPWTIVRMHEEVLRALPKTLHDFLWVFQADAWSIHEPSETTERWLKNGRGLLGAALRDQDASLFDFGYWCEESEREWNDSPMRGTMRKTYVKTFPLVFKRAAELSKRVKEGRHYWTQEAPEYLALVDATPIPERFDWEGIIAFVQEHNIREPW